MKLIFVILFIFLWVQTALAEVSSFLVIEDVEYSQIEYSQSEHTMALTNDGKLLIDGVQVEKMNHPEIIEALKSIVKLLEGDSMVRYLDKQTEMLLRQLDECLTNCPRRT